MNLIFMGTSEFAVPSLKSLIEKENVLAVVTKPDAPKGRGRIITPSPIKSYFSDKCKILQPEDIKDPNFIESIKMLSPELIVVVAYGKILPRELLELPKYGAINLHASLLPKYRGPAPINWALINGEEKTGVTTIFMEEKVDSGDIILRREVRIEDRDNAETLGKRLALIGAELLIESINLIKSGEVRRIPQNHELATYAPALKKSDGLIDWSLPNRRIFNMIRGMNPWPSAFTYLNGSILKIYEARTSEGEGLPGEIIGITDEGIEVATGKGSLILTEIQLENRKRMKAKDFLRGHPLSPGIRLGKTT